MTKPRRPQRLKAKEPKTCMTSARHARPTSRMARKVRLTAERVKRDAPPGQQPAGNAFGVSVRVGDYKIKDKEKGKAEHRECI